MNNIYSILDAAMCMLWITTYTLVLIGTVKYKYILISPITQAIIAPFEFSVFLMYFLQPGLQLNYASIAYHYWTVIEVVIFIFVLKYWNADKKFFLLYFIFVVTMIAAMFDLVTMREYMFFFSYFNTFIGMLFWFGHVCKKDYPMKPWALAAFVAKFMADSIAVVVYFGDGMWLINTFCILLPLLDFLFIAVYFKKRRLRHAL